MFTQWHFTLWVIVGLIGQLLFAGRFLIQWISSERKKESHIPISFWYLSLAGGLLLLFYSIYRKDPVFIIGQGAGIIVYVRNLILIYRAKHESAALTDRSPQGQMREAISAGQQSM